MVQIEDPFGHVWFVRLYPQGRCEPGGDADNETNHCARCQTGGELLADRSLSRLLKSDWPRKLDELEALKRK